MRNPARLLEELNRSRVFDSDFPKRHRYTHAEFSNLTESELHSIHEPKLEAIKSVRDFNRLVEIVRRLADAKYEDSIPTLAAIWRDCALEPLRTAAGHALLGIASPEARKVLTDLIEDSDWLSAYLGVRAVFDESPMEAFDKLLRYFDSDRVRQSGGSVIPCQVLSIFSPSSFDHLGNPGWTVSQAREWLRDDPRWINLCVRLRHDEILGYSARDVLRFVDVELFEQVLALVKRQEVPKNIRTCANAFGDLVDRYRRGEHRQVWNAIRAYDVIEGDFRTEVEAVARETMKRVARNLDLLASRLEVKGWKPLIENLRTQPASDVDAVFSEIERITQGPLPPSLKLFWEVVGGVDFIWDYNSSMDPPILHPEFHLALDLLDPLAVISPNDLAWQFEEWEHERQTTHPELLDPFLLELAPDYLHKADISGGAPYGINLPFFGADPIFANEEHAFPFVDYLRHCLKWGGFPRLERHQNESGVSELVSALTEDFDPF